MDSVRTFAGCLVALLVIAFLVHRHAPEHRGHVRRIVIVVSLFGVSLLLEHALIAIHDNAWARRFRVATDILEVFAILQLAATFILDLAFPLAKIRLAGIASDLILGVAYVVGLLGVLQNHGMSFSSVVTTGAVVSGVLALSLQSTLGNVIGGIALQLDGSVHVGEWIQLENGRQGRVRQIRWRHTVLETRDWSTLIVPNASLLGSQILLLGMRGGGKVPQRMWVYFHVDFRHAPGRVVEVVTQALHASRIENVADDPKPNCVCMDLARDGSYATYAVRYWLTDLAVDDPTNSAVRARVHAALRRAGIPLARPATKTFLELENKAEDEAERGVREHARRMNALAAVNLFQPLTEDEREVLADHMVFAPFAAGETITKQGGTAHWLYILVSGSAEVRIHSEGAPAKTVATLTAPDFFGEMGLMTGEPRKADVVASRDTECFRLGKDGFHQILLARPDIARELSETLAKRRVGLDAVREGLDQEAALAREAREAAAILESIRSFFGL